MKWILPAIILSVVVVALFAAPFVDVQSGSPNAVEINTVEDSTVGDDPMTDDVHIDEPKESVEAEVLEKAVETNVTEKTLSVGESFTFNLASNPTTGYDWYIKSADGLTVDKEYKAKVTNPQLCGAGGTAIFTVTAEEAGEYTLVLNYERSFQKDSCVQIEIVKLTFV